MRCVTWSRDSHGLFDYESRFISKKNIKTVTEGRIVRLNNDVELIGMNQVPEDLDPNAKPLITITQNARGKYLSKFRYITNFWRHVGKFVITNDTGTNESSR